MDSQEIRQKFLNFFERRGHKIVPSSSLIPDDPSVLLTTAGMQQFKKYYTGEADPLKDFGVQNTVSVQKSFRTSDIDEVGDESHNTFFEMLGNFSFGGYFKKEAIQYAHEFIIKEMGLNISRVTIFKGSVVVPKDEESKKIWQSLGVKNIREEGVEDVFWGPTGTSGPCGPTTEIYCKNSSGKDIEVWNIVFNEFFCNSSREQILQGNADLKPLPEKGIDTGMGLERLAMVVQKKRNIFETDLFAPLLELLPPEIEERKKRIIVDHLRGATFLLADGVRPSNKEAGYILRRLIRRALAYENLHKIPAHVFDAIIHDIVHEYGGFYPELMRENGNIRQEFARERERFNKLYPTGRKCFDMAIGAAEQKAESVKISSQFRERQIERLAFKLNTEIGIPVDIIKEWLEERGYKLNEENFLEELKKHQEISRAGVEKKFGGHGLILDTGELKAGSEEELKIVTHLHTATHLLNAALHKVLGDEISQRGSDITTERTRFDFVFPRKMTPEEIKKVEDIVNEAIARDYPVKIEELPLEEAKKSGALFFYKGHYPEMVKVYSIGRGEEIFSRELCGGPHVARTGEIGKFKIIKEESSSAGIRRIRAKVF